MGVYTFSAGWKVVRTVSPAAGGGRERERARERERERENKVERLLAMRHWVYIRLVLAGRL